MLAITAIVAELPRLLAATPVDQLLRLVVTLLQLVLVAYQLWKATHSTSGQPPAA